VDGREGTERVMIDDSSATYATSLYDVTHSEAMRSKVLELTKLREVDSELYRSRVMAMRNENRRSSFSGASSGDSRSSGSRTSGFGDHRSSGSSG
jgi:hypothetical protein